MVQNVLETFKSSETDKVEVQKKRENFTGIVHCKLQECKAEVSVSSRKGMAHGLTPTTSAPYQNSAQFGESQQKIFDWGLF